MSHDASYPSDNVLRRIAPEDLMTLYKEGQHDRLATLFVQVFKVFATEDRMEMSYEQKFLLNRFISSFLYYMSMENFQPSRETCLGLIQCNQIICNTVAISDFETTDPFLQILMHQPNSLYKLMVLYNPRCDYLLDFEPMFQADPHMASFWYYTLLRNYKVCLASPTGQEVLQRLLKLDLADFENAQLLSDAGYFACTYIDPANDAGVKQRINASFKAIANQPEITTKPEKGKIAILSGLWTPAHPVYKGYHAFVEALANDYELTLIHFGEMNEQVDTALFSEVRTFAIQGFPLDLSTFADSPFGAAFYPDIGMTLESVVCANLRIAPVQIAGYGHPVSTHGSCIDYWIGGAAVESTEAAERNYSERLVLIPGLGVVPERRPFPPMPARRIAEGDPVRVSCVWSAPKINASLVDALGRVVDSVDRPVEFHFFPGHLRENGYLALKCDLEFALGPEAVTVHPTMNGMPFFEALGTMDFGIDSYPFGGYTAAVDTLAVGRPFVTWRGEKFYNRSASAVLEMVELNELVAGSEDEYVDLIVRMINDSGLRSMLTQRALQLDLETTLYDVAPAANAFKRTIDHLIQNHEGLAAESDRAPIMIS